jgi:predicted CoA-binding protein
MTPTPQPPNPGGPSNEASEDATAVRAILARAGTIAVVGLSPKTHRASYEVSAYMQQQGWRIIPVNPLAKVPEILGEKVYASLTEAAAQHTIDLVDVFRNSEDVPPIAAEAIAVGAKALWLQLGITHDDACDSARAAGLLVVQDKCLLVEHRHQALWL